VAAATAEAAAVTVTPPPPPQGMNSNFLANFCMSDCFQPLFFFWGGGIFTFCGHLNLNIFQILFSVFIIY
jgi:hypothetical protein